MFYVGMMGTCFIVSFIIVGKVGEKIREVSLINSPNKLSINSRS